MYNRKYKRSPFPVKVRSDRNHSKTELNTMKAQIYINRHIVRANKKATNETEKLVDKAAIAINTYLGSVYAKEIEFTAGCKLIQDAANARCSGATIWLESEFESLVIDGVKANRSMFDTVIRTK
jgi:hypothetical protein